MTSIITWYIIGILVSTIGIFSYEYFYLYDKEIEYISTKEVVEDVLLSFLSWIMVAWLIISVILDICMGWPSKGYDLNIKGKSTQRHSIKYNGIHTIVVLTAENPDSKQATNQSNKKASHSLLSEIKNGGYAYVPAIGRLGNTECPYAVFNMSVNSAMLLCRKYQQTSFVYSELKDDGSIHSEYFEKLDTTLPFGKETNNYAKKDECDTWDDMSDADDYFTVIGNKFNYSIPLPIINTVNETICDNLGRAVAIQKERGSKTINESELLDFTINCVGQSPYLWRKALTKGL